MFEIIGFQPVSFTSKEGNAISGVSFWVTFSNNNVVGLKAEKMFISSFKLNNCGYDFNVGDTVNILFNRFGKPESIELA